MERKRQPEWLQDVDTADVKIVEEMIEHLRTISTASRWTPSEVRILLTTFVIYCIGSADSTSLRAAILLVYLFILYVDHLTRPQTSLSLHAITAKNLLDLWAVNPGLYDLIKIYEEDLYIEPHVLKRFARSKTQPEP